MQSVPKRILREIEDLHTAAVAEAGIFYAENETNLRTGQAMIIGPEGTPYAFCPLLFSISLPATYPVDSPKVEILTSDSITRFHPNLYTSGKVCLSILGTWQGPAWCAVMTVRTVLTSILSLLDDNPIANEPGYSTEKKDSTFSASYSEAVQYRLAAYTLDLFLKWKNRSTAKACFHPWTPFKEVLDERGDAWLKGLWSVIQSKCVSGGPALKVLQVAYGMNVTVDWSGLLAKGVAAGLSATS